MRTLYEGPRGCGYRQDGGTYLTGEIGSMGDLSSCVLVDPPIPVDTKIIPFSRGIYTIDLNAVFTTIDQRQWLIETSSESLRKRDFMAYEMQRYGMSLHARLRVGICAGMTAEQAEVRLGRLQPARGTFLSDYILGINYSGKGRRVAKETALMQRAKLDGDYLALLASCWRLSHYKGQGEQKVRDNVKRIMVSIGALEDAANVE